MIDLRASGHALMDPRMTASDTLPAAAQAGPMAERATPAEVATRLRTVVVGHHALVWRALRRFGVSCARVDEAVSRVFDVLTRRLGDVVPGKEQAFLIQVAARVASEFRRSDVRRARVEELGAQEGVTESPSPEELFEQREARALLDDVLDEIEPDARAVFVLHELEQWTGPRIAESLNIPQGTVSSRLRRAREQFERAASQLRRRLESKGGQP